MRFCQLTPKSVTTFEHHRVSALSGLRLSAVPFMNVEKLKLDRGLPIGSCLDIKLSSYRIKCFKNEHLILFGPVCIYFFAIEAALSAGVIVMSIRTCTCAAFSQTQHGFSACIIVPAVAAYVLFTSPFHSYGRG